MNLLFCSTHSLTLYFSFVGSDFLNDFFKPVTSELEHLKSFKKNRHGRRVKQLERYELKMKEERQKRIRERQKEFFTEIEVHKYVPYLPFSTCFFHLFNFSNALC